MKGIKSFGGDPPKGLIYEGGGVRGDSCGRNDLGEVEVAEGDVHGGCKSWEGEMGKITPEGITALHLTRAVIA